MLSYTPLFLLIIYIGITNQPLFTIKILYFLRYRVHLFFKTFAWNKNIIPVRLKCWPCLYIKTVNKAFYWNRPFNFFNHFFLQWQKKISLMTTFFFSNDKIFLLQWHNWINSKNLSSMSRFIYSLLAVEHPKF